MITIILLLAAVSFTPTVFASTKCSREYKKVGCLKHNATLFSKLLITDLDKTHRKWGDQMDWSHFGQSLHSLACRCREKAVGKYKYFSLGFYGECKAAENTQALEEKINDPGIHASTSCVSGQDFDTCDSKSQKECAGVEDNEFVYEVVEGCWSHISGGCVSWHNIIKYHDKSVEECKKLCLQRPNCVSFEYGVDHGGKGTHHKLRDCQLQHSANYAGCNGKYHNLDLYIKKKCTQESCPEGGIAYPGNDIMGRKITESWKQCSGLCRTHDACRFWTFTPSKNWCYLKSSDKGGREMANKISGSRTCGVEPATYECIYATGNGEGVGQIWAGLLNGTDCAEVCAIRRKKDPTINGAKVYSDTSKKGCWCQKTMSVVNMNVGKYKTCFLQPQEFRCSGENNGCCTKETPCQLGQGDCDSDAQCAGSLICGRNNCPWGDGDDCCSDVSGLRCSGQNNGCCTKENPCNVNEGDCDSDDECAGSYVCGKDNCPWGDKDDCCSLRCSGENDGCCTKEKPCNVGEGDCDSDNQCAGSLVCGEDNCPWGDGDDCCVKEVCPEGGIGYPGNDIGGRRITKSWEECSTLCRNEAKCKFWTFTPSHHWCYIKTSDKGRKKLSNKISGSRECRRGLRCSGQDNGCCTKDMPCGEDEGDCDTDAECAGSLLCGKDNCPWGDGDDCCVKPN